MVAIMYPCDTFSTKKFTIFYSIGDSLVCLLVFALLVLPVRSLPPAILPSDLGTTIRESPVLRVLEGRPRCIGRDFDGIFQAAWLAPPWTSQAACGSSQTFFHPFFYVRRTLWRCPIALHINASNERPDQYENNPRCDRHQRAFCSIFNSFLCSRRRLPAQKPPIRPKSRAQLSRESHRNRDNPYRVCRNPAHDRHARCRLSIRRAL